MLVDPEVGPFDLIPLLTVTPSNVTLASTLEKRVATVTTTSRDAPTPETDLANVAVSEIHSDDWLKEPPTRVVSLYTALPNCEPIRVTDTDPDVATFAFNMLPAVTAEYVSDALRLPDDHTAVTTVAAPMATPDATLVRVLVSEVH